MLAPQDDSPDLRFTPDGAQLFAKALDEAACVDVEQALAGLAANVPGVRIGHGARLKPFLVPTGPIGAAVADLTGRQAIPVRALLLDKTAARNWALGWHQDRTIVVRERKDAAGFGPWTVKSGLIQVEPPFAILERMVTVRLHLDAVDETNAPLHIVPGSHRLGRLRKDAIGDVVACLGERINLAARGDLWIYATPIVHRLLAGNPPRRRRVLQVDYSGDLHPGELRWQGL